ncbi:hypothetical protein GCM10027515_08760 [Schumannella luteola]|uniref:Uncharacterized protein n=1 Tax=Schumannella luteola TaxID=472059 RepID=A0A852YLB2_9MICO|nr:hypothetical protein [Schumannella luteola]NYG97995.1 hypothetical protein [Schumannella luteola]TPX01730.1 hypothetical protein FJ656_25370 [Schumannella luteola]
MSPSLEPIDVTVGRGIRDRRVVYRHTGVFDGTELTVLYLVDDDEHQRRKALGVEAVTDERILAALMELPTDDLGLLPERFRLIFQSPTACNASVVIDDPDGARWGRRLIQAPVEVLEIQARARTWARGSAIAHRWVGYGPRIVWIDKVPRDEAFLLTEAAHYGIGLVHGDEGRRLIAPSCYEPERWTSARWRFAELVYDQFLDAISIA